MTRRGTARRRRLSRAIMRALCAGLVVATIVMWRAASIEAQAGCCYCDDCPADVGPLCTDLTDLVESCADLCLAQRGCTIIEFSQSATCAQGCGSKPPFFSPTPTATPTPTVSASATISPTPSITPTPSMTATALYCCQATGAGDRCGTANPPNEAACMPDETPIPNAMCVSGLCITFTPVASVTPTAPTRTFTVSPTQTPTKTRTPTVTPTVTIGGFALNPFSCYRMTGSQLSAKKVAYTVEDAFGVRTKKILKPRYVCAPSDVEFDDVTGIPKAETFLTCYKSQDTPKAARARVTVRNALDDGLALEVVKGDLVCLPSYVAGPPTVPRPPTATPTP